MSAKIWFITGTSRGFGREWALAALERGDSVVATARNASSLDALVAAHGDAVLPISLDVTDRGAVFAAVAQAHEHFGRLDVVVNNAGYGQFGMVEELSEAESREQIETNLFGALWVTQAALPFLRAQGSGHLLLDQLAKSPREFDPTGAATDDCKAQEHAPPLGIRGPSRLLESPQDVVAEGEGLAQVLEREAPLFGRGHPEEVAHAARR